MLTHSIFSFFGGLSWIFLVWAIAEERFNSNLSGWQLKDLELWRCWFWTEQGMLKAVLPSAVKRVLYSASDCLIFSMSTGRVAG